MNWWVVSLFRNIRTSAVGPMNIVSCHPYTDFIFNHQKLTFFRLASDQGHVWPHKLNPSMKSVPWISSCRSTFLSHMIIFEGSIGTSIRVKAKSTNISFLAETYPEHARTRSNQGQSDRYGVELSAHKKSASSRSKKRVSEPLFY